MAKAGINQKPWRQFQRRKPYISFRDELPEKEHLGDRCGKVCQFKAKEGKCLLSFCKKDRLTQYKNKLKDEALRSKLIGGL